MSQRQSAKVLDNQPVGPSVYLLSLEAPAIAAAARPGQFVMLRVSPGPEPLLARPFSVHGVRGGKLLILYQVVGKGTELLSRARPGQELLAWGPLGRGFGLEVERPALVAGGMGVAPLAFLAERLEERSAAFEAFYGLASRETLTAWDPVSGEGAFYLEDWGWHGASEDGSQGHHGLATQPLEDWLERAGSPPGAVLACGPLPMLKAVAAICAKRGLPCQVSLEAPMACGVGACLGCAIPAAGGGYLRACQEGPVMDASTVDWDKV
ncbi:MAG: dihydroorotate dehydrogenase electron transfer subunit [Proteobacteria bacterium]|nr:dihydroorotate dehydrogenase electron transfer subunit [Pseudomonadota bacterium]MBU1451281.1 dihydroorotate dehydrogenase electron transfer subunit [Pseudomonadota bacterium]MBU2468839.1 dihydroorotate dehydrogenase electron transfer subunit [Pseudomonadota bacterium]